MQPAVQQTDLLSYLTFILLNPGFNTKLAFVLYGTIALFLLLVLAIGIALLSRPPAHPDPASAEDATRDAMDEFERLAPGERFEGLDLEDGAANRAARPQAPVSAPRPKDLRSRALTAGAVAAVVLLVLAASGYTTSDSKLCRDCHWPTAKHAQAVAGTDPHAKVACVSCHEPGGSIGRYLTDVPSRLVHFAGALSSVSLDKGYGRVTITACSSCHAKDMKGVATEKTRGLKISHKEPLAAAATCVDCHSLRGGVVGTHNAGMAPCLRCHDSKQASAECATCHDEKAKAAARVRTASLSKVQIADLTCGGCHDEKQQCDWCHGLRMPHSVEFKAYAHARAGAVDLWYNGGKMCGRCHTASRRSCQMCHGATLGAGHGKGSSWLARSHQTAQAEGCDKCHGQFAYAATRDFCTDVCHTPAARAASPR